MVVVDGRVFARSWTSRPDGWYRTFLDDPLGTLQVGEREVRVRARRVTGERLLDQIEDDEQIAFLEEALDNLAFTEDLDRFDLMSYDPEGELTELDDDDDEK